MSPALLVLVTLFVLAYGAVGIFAVRRRLLGRLALREAVRRRGQTLLVVAGLMVGTATITAALVAADSVGDSTVDAFAYNNWGYVDLTVTATNQFFPRDVADRLAPSPAVARSSRAGHSSRPCAKLSAIPAPRKAVAPETAAPVRCSSMGG